MKIKTLGDFRKLTKEMDDSVTFDFRVRKEVSKEELIKRHYPYPFDTTYFNHIEYDDYSHSEKELCLGVTFNLKEEQNER